MHNTRHWSLLNRCSLKKPLATITANYDYCLTMKLNVAHLSVHLNQKHLSVYHLNLESCRKLMFYILCHNHCQFTLVFNYEIRGHTYECSIEPKMNLSSVLHFPFQSQVMFEANVVHHNQCQFWLLFFYLIRSHNFECSFEPKSFLHLNLNLESCRNVTCTNSDENIYTEWFERTRVRLDWSWHAAT